MSMVINTNIMSINAQNNLRTSQNDMNTAMERLSSGKRVNSAADDAAGLAIINRFTSQERGLNIAIRNANDGISLIQTAEGALDETTNILQRMRELSIQSANGIYSDANRATLNAEVTQLKAELTRIAETTSFNGLKILDGALGDIELQVGAESGERIVVNTGTGFDAESLGTTGVATENTGTFELVQSVSAEQSGVSGTLDTVADGDLSINGVDIPAASSFDTVSSSDNGASALGLAEAINSTTVTSGVSAVASNSINLGDIDISTWTDLGALVLSDGDGAAAASGATYSTGAIGTAGATGIDISGTNDYQFVVEINGVSQAVDISTTAVTPASTSNLTQVELAAMLNEDLSGITVTVDGTGTGLIFTQDTASAVGDSLTFTAVGANAGALNLTGGTSTTVTDAPSTLTIAAGELNINGEDISGSFSTVSLDAFVADLNSNYGGADLTFDTDGSKLWAQSASGSDITITSTAAFASGDTLSIGGVNYANAAANNDFSAASTTLGAGDLTINGEDITGTVKTREDLVSAINAKSSLTGVTASLDTNALVLTATDGRNIQIQVDGDINAATETNATTGFGAGITLADFDLSTADLTGQTYAGTVTLSGSNIELVGDNTAGFSSQTVVSALTTAAAGNTFESLSTGDLTINGYNVVFDPAGFTGSSVVDDDDSAEAIASAINSTAGLKDEIRATALTVMNLGEISAGSLTDLDLTINGELVSFTGDLLDGDSDGNLVGTINTTIANGGTSTAEGIVASINANNELILTAEDGRNIDVQVTVAGTGTGASGLFANIDASVQDTTGVVTKGTIALTAQEGFSLSEVGGDKAYLAGIVNANGDSIASIDISTQTGAQDAIAVVDRALDYIADARGDLGAASNRLEFTINNLSSVVENAAAARSRVQDADFAVESAALARAQVLQQAGTAMLAQANAAPQSVLSLLQ
ncbi:MAG: hypothetical protein HWE12_15970 [Oceanospirillaceae bacterium]|nr:hypothetical protein [Oceanospirillaceae bacterium]